MRYLYVNKYVYVISFLAHLSHCKSKTLPDNNINFILMRRS